MGILKEERQIIIAIEINLVFAPWIAIMPLQKAEVMRRMETKVKR